MQASKINLAVFASGRGSNAENIFRSIKESSKTAGPFPLNISCLITDKHDAGVLQYADEYGIPFSICPYKGSKAEQEKAIINFLDNYKIDYILLCGYMRILSENFIRYYSRKNESHSRIINIHPSLLPAFPGRDGYGDAFASGIHRSGVTIHFVDEGVDTGPIIMQKSFLRLENDTLEDFKQRGLTLEHQMYRELLNELEKSGEIQHELK